MRETCPNCPPANRRAYSAFLIEWIDTASVMVSTRPEEPPVMRIRKLKKKVSQFHRDAEDENEAEVAYCRAQHWEFSSFHIRLNSWISCTASCSWRRSPPVFTITEKQSQLACEECQGEGRGKIDENHA